MTQPLGFIVTEIERTLEPVGPDSFIVAIGLAEREPIQAEPPPCQRSGARLGLDGGARG
jgi:hypothetical protein